MTRASAFIRACLVTAGALGAPGCSEPYPHPREMGAGAPEPRYGGTLHLASPFDPGQFDPASSVDQFTESLDILLYERLVEIVPGTAEVGPDLADRWDVRDEGKTVRFFLAPEARFHDGTSVTADDVRWSLERMLDPARTASWAANQFDRIVGYDDFRAHRSAHLEGLLVVDEHTVEVHLTAPEATILQRFALGPASIVPRASFERLGRDAFGNAPIGSGPLAFESWEHGTRLTLRRTPGYHRPRALYYDRLVIDLSVPSAMIAMRLQRGDIDLAPANYVEPAERIWFQRHRGWRASVVPPVVTTIMAICMNTELPPWNDRALRRAVAFAIDRDTLALTRRTSAEPLTTLFPRGFPGHQDNPPWAQRFDLAEARRELTRAGYPDGLPGEQEFWVSGDAGTWVLAAQDLARIGIHVRFRSVGTDYGALARRGVGPLVECGWGIDFPDPVDLTDPSFHSRSIADDGSPNVAFYSNPTLDTLLDRARSELEPARRLAMYAAAERIIVEDAPWAFVFAESRAGIVQSYVRGYHASVSPALDLRGIWLDEPRRPWRAPP